MGRHGAVGKVIERLGQRNKWPRRGKKKQVEVPVPSHLNWLLWRPVVEKVATLQEILTVYDLVDLLDIHESLDLQGEAQFRASEAD